MNEIIYAGKHLITFSVCRHAHSSWEFILRKGSRADGLNSPGTSLKGSERSVPR